MKANLIEESKKIKHEIRTQTIGYIIAAFGLVAGLAWNEAVKALIDSFFKDAAHSLTAKFLYAIAITMIVVVLTMYLVRIKEKKAEDPKLKDLGVNETEL
ncbi:MAG: hypothetical protein JWO40_811 [Candidatus Doudnabacteria bacterium]|nr:hypothetical protein [Candidatus Doudnabacteria bacterium]